MVSGEDTTTYLILNLSILVRHFTFTLKYYSNLIAAVCDLLLNWFNKSKWRNQWIMHSFH